MLLKYTGKYVKIYFVIKITFTLRCCWKGDSEFTKFHPK